MEKNCSTCKVSQINEWHDLCNKCIVNYPEEGTEDNYQPLDPTYTREEVFDLMCEAYDEGYSREDSRSCKTILDNFDKIKNQKK